MSFFRVVCDLQKNWEYSVKGSHKQPHQVSLIIILHYYGTWLLLMNQYQCHIVNQSSQFIHMSSVFTCSLSLFQDCIQDTILHLVIMPLLALLGCEGFSYFSLFLMSLNILRIGQGYCRVLFSWNLSDVFLTSGHDWGLWVWGRKIVEVKFNFHCIIPMICTINMIYDCWCWPWWHGSVRQVFPL